MLESISSSFTKWNKHMMDTRDYQVSFTFGPCDYQQEVSLRVHLLDFISKAVGTFYPSSLNYCVWANSVIL